MNGPTGGLNGTTFLTGNVFNDTGAKDSLTGGAGQDWFILSIPDILKDPVTGEVTTTI
ncbi:hypothetical protein [Zavarzinella formosa]|uniref:hypothetical protein n=1 Tax=Zavarzinella formosa TaxID=360055 RepID=UPI0002F3D746|nr:hypothetical protein [Zavarzinella formosa]